MSARVMTDPSFRGGAPPQPAMTLFQILCGSTHFGVPVEHGYAVREARPGGRLDALPGLGHFAHVQSPTAVVAAI